MCYLPVWKCQLSMTEFEVPLISHGRIIYSLVERLGINFGHVVDQNDPHSVPDQALSPHNEAFFFRGPRFGGRGEIYNHYSLKSELIRA